MADTTAQIAHLGNEARLRKQRLLRARLWKHVLDLGDLTFRVLRCGVKLLAKHLSSGVLECSDVRARENSKRSGDVNPVRDSEAEWIEVAVPEAALSLVEHRQRDGLVRFHRGNSLVEHCSGFFGRADRPL